MSNSSLPSNADRAALAKILGTIRAHERGDDGYKSCDDTVRVIQGIAVTALNEPTKIGDYWRDWLPDAEHLNALPQPIRQYIHDLETRADPAGDVAEIAFLKDTVEALQARIRELELTNY
jgi:hypothetical protein